MERRNFIKASCLTCASVIGAGALLSALQSCKPLAVLKTDANDGIINVSTSSFVEEQKLLLIRNQKMEYDILLVKKQDNTYNALYMECTHQNQPLTANKNGLFCSAHGSSFDLEGNVKQEPATKPLRKFKTEITDNNIKIYIN